MNNFSFVRIFLWMKISRPARLDFFRSFVQFIVNTQKEFCVHIFSTIFVKAHKLERRDCKIQFSGIHSLEMFWQMTLTFAAFNLG